MKRRGDRKRSQGDILVDAQKGSKGMGALQPSRWRLGQKKISIAKLPDP